jgi:hypothetical protein
VIDRLEKVDAMTKEEIQERASKWFVSSLLRLLHIIYSCRWFCGRTCQCWRPLLGRPLAPVGRANMSSRWALIYLWVHQLTCLLVVCCCAATFGTDDDGIRYHNCYTPPSSPERPPDEMEEWIFGPDVTY